MRVQGLQQRADSFEEGFMFEQTTLDDLHSSIAAAKGTAKGKGAKKTKKTKKKTGKRGGGGESKGGDGDDDDDDSAGGDAALGGGAGVHDLMELPRGAMMAVSSMFSFLEEAAKVHPKLCEKPIAMLLQFIDGLGPQVGGREEERWRRRDEKKEGVVEHR
jgi:hypothetical protein